MFGNSGLRIVLAAVEASLRSQRLHAYRDIPRARAGKHWRVRESRYSGAELRQIRATGQARECARRLERMIFRLDGKRIRPIAA